MTSSNEPVAPPQAPLVRHWQGLFDGAPSLALAETAARHDHLLVYVAGDTERGIRTGAELSFYGGDLAVRAFPEWETLPYDHFSPHQDIVSARVTMLHDLPRLTDGVLVVPIATLLQRLPPPEFVRGKALLLEVGGRFDLARERELLVRAGYRTVETVSEHGEFAIRGSIIDIFPSGARAPYRIDLLDDEIDSLRTFDPDTQRSIEAASQVRVLPAHEVPLDDDGIERFCDAWHVKFDIDVRRCQIYQDVSSGIAAQGIEYYLPLFFEHTATLFDYLPESTVFVLEEDALERGDAFLGEVESRHESLRYDSERPILPPNDIYLTGKELAAQLAGYARIVLDPEGRKRRHKDAFDSKPLPDLAANHRVHDVARKLRAFIGNIDGPVLLTAETPGRRAHLDDFLRRVDIHARDVEDFAAFEQAIKTNADGGLYIAVAPMDRGLWRPDFAVVTESEILGRHADSPATRSRRREVDADLVIRNLTELHVGAPVVHIDHGVGRYRGLEVMHLGGIDQEFLELEYEDGAKLYVPVTSLDLVSRYSGADEEHAPLHRLGTDQWDRAKRRAAEKIHDVAAELLDIYARREAARSYAFGDPDSDYYRFCEQFPFETTPDQESAIDAIVKDMTSERAMDRLVCGDVGFGKTEVAMRAAYVAVQSNKQVAVLVPTTLLAQQHAESFRDRFADWPVEIDVVSRLRSEGEVGGAVERLRQGRIDILIGTHRILGKDFAFKDLGLVIIDEEHRFGVRQKERLRSLRAEVDVLALTATPIPRTLNMAMSGMRDLSIIATPPAKRLSIKTFVSTYRRGLVVEAITRELARGGQVFYLHNEVRTINRAAEELGELVPQARIGVAHGQMGRRPLERVMADFHHRQVNVLVCSTIIENGIDIPNANTIIIERADKFGLAQLHQLRGRVGRSSRQAFAYLLTPHPKAMTEDARKRLDAIESSGELGIGFTIATHDLEIRGAGELLGENQSGQIEVIGFSLYMEMLERAVRSIREGRVPNINAPLPEPTHEIHLHVPSLIPEHYLPDVHARLIMYKRINHAPDAEALDDLKIEMIDRFGLLPDSVANLLRTMLVKLDAQAIGIIKIDIGAGGGRVDFADDARVEPATLVRMVQGDPEAYQLKEGPRLRITRELESTADRFAFVENLLQTLSADTGQGKAEQGKARQGQAAS